MNERAGRTVSNELKIKIINKKLNKNNLPYINFMLDQTCAIFFFFFCARNYSESSHIQAAPPPLCAFLFSIFLSFFFSFRNACEINFQIRDSHTNIIVVNNVNIAGTYTRHPKRFRRLYSQCAYFFFTAFINILIYIS